MPPSPVVVVGAGIAGISCARELAAAGIPVTVRDRSFVPGGRMSSRTVAGRRVDLGASYFTSRSDEFQVVVDSWLERGLAREWADRFAVHRPDGWDVSDAGPMRYGTAGGLRSLVADLAQGLTVQTRSEVTTSARGRPWTACRSPRWCWPCPTRRRPTCSPTS